MSSHNSEIDVRIAAKNGQISRATETVIRDGLFELYRRHRRLKVLHVEIDLHHGDAATVAIKAWGTNARDRGSVGIDDPEIDVVESNASVMIAFESATRNICNQFSRSRTDESADRKSVSLEFLIRYGPYTILGIAIIALMIVIANQVGFGRADDARLIENHFRTELKKQGLDPNKSSILIPSSIAARWLSDFVDMHVTPDTLKRRLQYYVDEGRMRYLVLDPIVPAANHDVILWSVAECKEIDKSLLDP